jgi:hypothetical protein
MNYSLNFDNQIGFFRGRQANDTFAHQNEPEDTNYYNPLN